VRVRSEQRAGGVRGVFAGRAAHALHAACVLALGGVTIAPAGAQPLPSPAGQPEQAPRRAPADEWAKLAVPAELARQLVPGPALVNALSRVASFVQAGPSLQRITVTHRTLAGEGQPPTDVQSQALLSIVPDASGVPTLRLDAGSLILTLSRDRAGDVPTAQPAHVLRAFSTLNPDIYWQRTLSNGEPLAQQLDALLPPLPFPSLRFALDGQAGLDALRAQLDAPAQALSGGAVRTPAAILTETLWRGVSPDGSLLVGDNALLRVDAATGQPLSWLLDLSPSPDASAFERSLGPLLLVQVEFLTPALTTHEALASFAPAVQSRERVPTLTALVAKPVEVLPGSSVPVLALLDGELRGWQGLEEMLRQSEDEARTGEAHPARSAIIVLFEPGTHAIEAKAREAALAAEGVLRTLNIRQLRGGSLTPRVLVASAAAMELEQMRAERAKQLTAHWQQRGAANAGLPAVVESPLLFSSGGRKLLDRFAHRSRAMVLVVAGDGTLIRTLPLDDRAVQREALARELLMLIPDGVAP
jgi:hypothetical protein